MIARIGWWTGLGMPCLVSVSVLAGCAQGIEETQYQVRAIDGATADQVFDAGVAQLRREFALNVDRSTHTATAKPREFSATRDTGVARELVGGSARLRRTARFAVAPRGDAVIARVRIDIERQDLAPAAAPTGGYRLSDSPAYIAIEHEGATTSRQNAIWTRLRRDREAERQFLNELRERFSPAPPLPPEAPVREAPAASAPPG